MTDKQLTILHAAIARNLLFYGKKRVSPNEEINIDEYPLEKVQALVVQDILLGEMTTSILNTMLNMLSIKENLTEGKSPSEEQVKTDEIPPEATDETGTE